MRLLLAIALVLLFLWLHKAQTSSGAAHGNACEATSVSGAAVSLLLSPLSLYSWLAATLLRLVLSVPALLLSSLQLSVLLILAFPWCVATVCASLLLTCLHVALYLLHLALVVAAVAVLAVTRRRAMADGDAREVEASRGPKNPKERPTKTRLFGRRVAQQG